MGDPFKGRVNKVILPMHKPCQEKKHYKINWVANGLWACTALSPVGCAVGGVYAPCWCVVGAQCPRGRGRKVSAQSADLPPRLAEVPNQCVLAWFPAIGKPVIVAQGIEEAVGQPERPPPGFWPNVGVDLRRRQRLR